MYQIPRSHKEPYLSDATVDTFVSITNRSSSPWRRTGSMKHCFLILGQRSPNQLEEDPYRIKNLASMQWPTKHQRELSRHLTVSMSNIFHTPHSDTLLSDENFCQVASANLNEKSNRYLFLMVIVGATTQAPETDEAEN